jgi:cobalt-zinc-cadmium resistance protein CzcA
LNISSANAQIGSSNKSNDLEPAKRISLNEAIEAAINKNGHTVNAQLQEELAKSKRKSAVDIGKTNVELVYGQFNSINKDNNITVSQSFSSPVLYANEVKLARENLKSTGISRAITEKEVIKNVKSTYYTLVYLLSKQRLLKSQDSLFARIEKASEIRFKTGETNLLEKISAQTQKLELENELSQNQADIEIYERQLQILIAAEEPVSVFDTVLTALPITTADTETLENSPRLSFFEQQKQVSRMLRKVEQARLSPDVNIGFFTQTLIGNQNINGTETYYSRKDRFNGIQAGIALPLWFGPQAARINSARISEKIAENNLQFQKQSLSGELDMLKQELRKNQKSLDFYEKSALPQADLILSQADKSFKAGAIDYLNFTQNINRALSIKSKHLEAIQAVNQTIISIENLTGK